MVRDGSQWRDDTGRKEDLGKRVTNRNSTEGGVQYLRSPGACREVPDAPMGLKEKANQRNRDRSRAGISRGRGGSSRRDLRVAWSRDDRQERQSKF